MQTMPKVNFVSRFTLPDPALSINEDQDWECPLSRRRGGTRQSLERQKDLVNNIRNEEPLMSKLVDCEPPRVDKRVT